jgi:hypothetical protein
MSTRRGLRHIACGACVLSLAFLLGFIGAEARGSEKTGGAGGAGDTSGSGDGSQQTKSNKSGKGGDQSQKDGSGPSGNPSNAPFESQMLAYGAVDKIAHEIVNHVCQNVQDDTANRKVRVVLYDPNTFTSIQSYGAFEANLQVLTAAYENVRLELGGTKTASVGPLDVASLILQYAAASTTETAGGITISDSAIRMSIAHYLTSGIASTDCAQDDNHKVDVTLYYPAVVLQTAAISEARKALGKELDDLFALRGRVAAKLKPDHSDPKDEINQHFQAVTKAHDDFMASLRNVDSTTGVAGIVPVLQGYALHTVLDASDSYIVYEEAVAGGGTQRNRKNLFTNVFWGDIISYSGGVIINFALLNGKDSSIVLASTLRYRTPFTRIKNPKHSSGDNHGDNLDSIDQ